MRSFIATQAPPGWKVGRWTQVDAMTWEERKIDNPSEAYMFSAANDGVKTTAIRLRLQGTTTEVLLLETSIQIFVNGRYFGEYIGHWDGPPPPGLPAAFMQGPGQPPSRGAMTPPGPPPVPGLPPSRGGMTPADGGKAVPGFHGGGPPYASPTNSYVSVDTTTLKLAPPGVTPGASPYAAATPSNVAGRGEVTFAPSNWLQVPPPVKADGANKDRSPAMVQRLFRAAKEGDAAEVQRLLGMNIDPDAQTPDGATPLYAAADKGHVAVIEVLLAAGADPSIGKGEKTPMVAAFQKGNKEILSKLFATAFQSLESAVGPSSIYDVGGAGGYLAEADEAPMSAHNELREVTYKLSKLSKLKVETDWTDKHTPEPIPEMTDTEMMRESAVRHAMKTLADANLQDGRPGGSPRD